MRWIPRSFLVLTLAASLAPTAHAAKLVGIDGMTATVMQQHQSSFSGVAVRARIKTDSFIDNVELLPYVEYWRNSNTVQPFNIHSSRSDATMGSDIRYNMEVKSFRPYVGAGFGLHFMSSEVQAPDLGLALGRSSLVKGGVSLLGGFTFPLTGRLENFIEAKYHHLPGYGQVKLNMGLAFGL